MNEVTGITLTFENCERIYIPRQHIGDMWIGNVHCDIGRMGDNSIVKTKRCDEVFLELFPSANTYYASFGFEEDKRRTSFQRIMMYNDISAVDVHYEDGTKDEVYTPWCNAGENNDNQSGYITDAGHLYVGISESRDWKDYFCFEEITNKEMADYRRQAYS